MNKKAIIIGASTTGKTTIIKYLKESTNLPIGESDDVLTAMNGGKYPHDSEYKMNILGPQMVEYVLNQDSIIFFTNTHYFKSEDLEIARKNGFKVVQLILDRQQMEMRNRHRTDKEGYDDLSKHFEVMIAYQQDIFAKGLVDKIILADQPIEKVAKELMSVLESLPK